jgi:hypothetical protein
VPPVQVGNIHAEHPRNGAAVLSERVQSVKVTVNALKALVSEVGFPPRGEFPVGSYFGYFTLSASTRS